MNNLDSNYSKSISARLLLIMELTELEISGFAEFTGVSESHLYALINGNRKLTGNVAAQIGRKLKLEGWEILQLDYNIPLSIRKSPMLVEFHKDYKNIPEYFTYSLYNRKSSKYIADLIHTDLFSHPVYIWEIKDFCKKSKKNYTSKSLSQILNYLVIKGELKSEKRPIKKRDGSFGKRIVDVFWREK
ncbi:hypothetical protein [Pedobacter glucosidilyticus]|uniref:hypothetical protein n=1 Tax=Pedobacter glucosidilyticus TaxID=1122941 RepID=UPI0026F07B7A|nr:hypothetical protein [Pedobacter glucosidilyticus]